MHRLFVALRPPAIVRRQLTDAMGGIAAAEWADDAQLHITLRYVGRVERTVAEDIAATLGTVRAAPLTLAIAGVGAFDGSGHGAAVWAGVTPHDAITALHRKIDRALVQVGLAPEARAFLPHVTLARLRRGGGSTEHFLADRAMLSSAPFTLDHFLLYESHIGSGGARYEAIARFPLNG